MPIILSNITMKQLTKKVYLDYNPNNNMRILMKLKQIETCDKRKLIDMQFRFSCAMHMQNIYAYSNVIKITFKPSKINDN